MAPFSYSKWYIRGWMPLVVLLALPIVSYTDVSALSIWSVLLLSAMGWLAIVWAQRIQTPRIVHPKPHLSTEVGQRHLRAAVFFSILSLLGCQLVLREQVNSLGNASFDNLQERYIALVESSLAGDATSSIWSSIGNLLRAFFFIALTSYVAYTASAKALAPKLLLSALVGFALYQNFLLNVSRLQFVFFLLTLVIAATMVKHPLLRRKGLIITAGIGLLLFLTLTSAQRFDAKFDNQDVAADYVTTFFGVDVLPMGRWLVSHVGLAAFALSVYVIQGVPELVRLIADNSSPYAMGGHSFFLLLSPLLRLAGIQLEATTVAHPMTNQGFWWGFMGDLYIDFGVLFPFAYVAVLFAMVRVAKRYGQAPVYGLTLRALTAGMIMIVPYTGIFNTYAVSYAAILWLAARELKACRRAAPIKPTLLPTRHASTA